jgi:hypothetical protein
MESPHSAVHPILPPSQRRWQFGWRNVSSQVIVID